MAVQIGFSKRGVGWKGRGRPPAKVPREVLDALQHTYDESVQGEFSVNGASDAEIRAFVQLLRHGADQLGKRLRQQVNAGVLRFYLEDK